MNSRPLCYQHYALPTEITGFKKLNKRIKEANTRNKENSHRLYRWGKNIYKSQRWRKEFCVHWYCFQSVLKYDWRELKIHLMLATWGCVLQYLRHFQHTPHAATEALTKTSTERRGHSLGNWLSSTECGTPLSLPVCWNLGFSQMPKTPLHHRW